MSPELPTPIAAFVDANARLDVEGMVQPFAPKAIFTPDTIRQEDGQVVVEGPAHGDFKGSPIRFTYRFTLANDLIEAVEITA